MEASETKLENPPTTKRRGFVFLAVLAGLLPLGVIELGLRIAGVQSQSHDPYAEFGGEAPVFVKGPMFYRTAKAREPFLAPQSFSVEKGKGVQRIFCFGGSTVHGRPYQVATAFPKWLEIELNGGDQNGIHEVINCGGISYASFRIVPMVREVLEYEPNAIVLATGHNEFLEDRTYHQVKQRSWLRQRLDGLRLVAIGRGLFHQEKARPADEASEGGFKTRLDNLNGYASYHRDDAWRRTVMAQFQESVREIVRLCQQHDVPLYLVQLGSNLRDCPPFKSEHRAGLGVEDEQTWQEYFEKATELEETDLSAALEQYRKAAAIDSEFALLRYRLAKAMDRLGMKDDVLSEYLSAKDLDICPLRLSEAQHRFLEQLGSERLVTLVDARAAIASRSPDGIPGFDWYLDHVHPTIAGHQAIAREIYAKMTKNRSDLPPSGWPQRHEVYRAHMETLGPMYLRDGARRLAWLDNWARREKLADEIKPRDWTDHLRLALRRLDFGAEEEARESIAMAIELGGEQAQARISKLTEEMVEWGRVSTARSLGELAFGPGKRP